MLYLFLSNQHFRPVLLVKDFRLDMFLRQRWRDDRLANISTSESFPLVYDILRKLWIPDLYILNEKEGHTHDITVPNRLIHLAPDGRILYSQR